MLINHSNKHQQWTQQTLKTVLIFLFLLWLPVQDSLALEEFTHYQQTRYAIENSKIKESSGLACSKKNNTVLWTHNDSGHMPIIYAMSDRGKELGTFFLEDVISRDWEDMASFSLNGQPYILVADSGDNFGIFNTYTLSIFKEPDLRHRSPSALSPQWQINYRFADNKSYDVEAVAVDVSRNRIILLTKRTAQALIFEIPLKTESVDNIIVAEQVGEFEDIVHPTAMDITADGSTMIILTYGRIHLFDSIDSFKPKPLKKFRKRKHVIEYTGLFQPEGLCLSKDEKVLYVSSERYPRLIKIKNQQDLK
jgi:hypothetical protein